MSQYNIGTITVTNGSVNVTGTNTLWVTNGLDVLPPFLWLFVPEDGTFVEKVNSVDGEGALTLASPWPGVTLTDVAYRLHDGFGPAGLPIMDPGDAGTLGIVNDAMRRIETIFSDIFSWGPGDTFTFTGPSSSDATAWRGILLDTSFATPSDNDIPVYDSTGGQWILEPKPSGGSGITINQYDIIARLASGSGEGAGVAATDLAEEPTPAAGDFLLGWANGTTLNKFDVANLLSDATSIRGVPIDPSADTPSDGDILVFRDAGGDWILEAKPASGSNPALNDVSDVTITSVADNELLAFDSASGEWINQTATEAGLAEALHTHGTTGIDAGTVVRPATPGVWNPAAIDLSQSADYQPYTLSGNVVLELTGTPVIGAYNKVRITGDGAFTVQPGTGIVWSQGTPQDARVVPSGDQMLFIQYIGDWDGVGVPKTVVAIAAAAAAGGSGVTIRTVTAAGTVALQSSDVRNVVELSAVNGQQTVQLPTLSGFSAGDEIDLVCKQDDTLFENFSVLVEAETPGEMESQNQIAGWDTAVAQIRMGIASSKGARVRVQRMSDRWLVTGDHNLPDPALAPDQVPDLEWWLDADQGTFTLSTDDVTAWASKAGSIAATFDLISATAAVQDGTPGESDYGVLFDWTSAGIYYEEALTGQATGQFSWFLVFNSPDASDADPYLYRHEATSVFGSEPHIGFSTVVGRVQAWSPVSHSMSVDGMGHASLPMAMVVSFDFANSVAQAYFRLPDGIDATRVSAAMDNAVAASSTHRIGNTAAEGRTVKLFTASRHARAFNAAEARSLLNYATQRWQT